MLERWPTSASSSVWARSHAFDEVGLLVPQEEGEVLELDVGREDRLGLRLNPVGGAPGADPAFGPLEEHVRLAFLVVLAAEVVQFHAVGVAVAGLEFADGIVQPLGRRQVAATFHFDRPGSLGIVGPLHEVGRVMAPVANHAIAIQAVAVPAGATKLPARMNAVFGVRLPLGGALPHFVVQIRGHRHRRLVGAGTG